MVKVYIYPNLQMAKHYFKEFISKNDTQLVNYVHMNVLTKDGERKFFAEDIEKTRGYHVSEIYIHPSCRKRKYYLSMALALNSRVIFKDGLPE